MELSALGEKVFFWYRVYTGALALLYLIIAFAGAFFLLVPLGTQDPSPGEVMLIAGIYAVLGLIFFIIFAVATFLPPKPYNWIVGILMIAIGLTSCLLWPAAIPLLIYWIKPETQTFFGRRKSP